MPLELVEHPDGQSRCSWCGLGPANADYQTYHDTEWGLPTGDETRLFEKLCLEGFQAGLSWITVLRKRERFRQVFAGFDPNQLVKMTASDVDRLAQDVGIIRHRGKIHSVFNNAQCLLRYQDKKGATALAELIWSHEPKLNERPAIITPEIAGSMAQSSQSASLSKALRGLGFSFVGPTTMYALMQSVGVVNDHLEGCHRRPICEQLRGQFIRPV